MVLRAVDSKVSDWILKQSDRTLVLLVGIVVDSSFLLWKYNLEKHRLHLCLCFVYTNAVAYAYTYIYQH